MARESKTAIILLLNCGLGMTRCFRDSEIEKQENGSTVLSKLYSTVANIYTTNEINFLILPKAIKLNFFAFTKQAIKLFLLHQMYYNAKDEIGLICFGTQVTDNDVNEEKKGCFNIVSSREIHKPDIEFLKYVDSLECCTIEPNILDAVVVAADMITKKTLNKSYSKQIWLFTDAVATHVVNEEDEAPVTAHLQNLNVSFNSVILADDVHEESKMTRDLVERLSENCNGLHMNLVEYFRFLKSLPRKLSVLQTSKCRLTLEITNSFKMPVWIYLKAKEEKCANLKKQSNASKRSDGGDVTIERAYIIADDTTGTEVKKEERIKAYRYGKEPIPITEADASQMATDTGDRSLKCIGCLRNDRQKIVSTLIGSAECVCAAPENQYAALAMATLCEALSNLNCGLVCRFVWRKGAPPKLVYLTPVTQIGSVSMTLNYLPFRNDIRTLKFNPLEAVKYEDEVVMDQLLDSMMLMDKGNESLEPKNIDSPFLLRYAEMIFAKTLKQHCHPSDTVQGTCANQRSLISHFDQSRQFDETTVSRNMKELSNLFPLETMDSERDKKRYWRDIVLEKIEDGKQSKLVKLEDVVLNNQDSGETLSATYVLNRNLSVEEIEKLESMSVGTAQPIRDFETMINVKELDLTPKAIQLMCGVIERLICESIGDQFFQKAIKCIESLRKNCVKECEGEKFNDYLKHLKLLCQKSRERQSLWRMMCDLNLTLISNEEDHTTSISSNEAANFFVDVFEKVEETALYMQPDDDADIMDLIE